MGVRQPTTHPSLWGGGLAPSTLPRFPMGWGPAPLPKGGRYGVPDMGWGGWVCQNRHANPSTPRGKVAKRCSLIP